MIETTNARLRGKKRYTEIQVIRFFVVIVLFCFVFFSTTEFRKTNIRPEQKKMRSILESILRGNSYKKLFDRPFKISTNKWNPVSTIATARKICQRAIAFKCAYFVIEGNGRLVCELVFTFLYSHLHMNIGRDAVDIPLRNRSYNGTACIEHISYRLLVRGHF